MEDAYTFYVLIMGLPETLFWEAPISFLETVMENKTAYDGWESSERRRLSRQQQKQ